MTARIVIMELLPSGRSGWVKIVVSSEVSDGSQLTVEEMIFTLQQTLDGLRSGSIAPLDEGGGRWLTGRTRVSRN